MKTTRLLRSVALSAIIMLSIFNESFAEIRKGTPLLVDTEDSAIDFYIENPGEEYEVECQIGTEVCDQVAVTPISEETVPVHTIFLIDNSLSVEEKYRPMISEILTQQTANRMNGELYSLAVFSSGIDYILEDSSDYMQIKNAIESITYQNQETYLTDVLYELLKQLEQDGEHSFRRIVIASDGVDNKAIGYTKEELYNLLEKSGCPIYTLGCTNGNNNEELKNMFALSRMTGGISWLLDDVSDVTTVVEGISSLNDVVKVKISPALELCDGTTKGINLKIGKGEDGVQYVVQVQMPFGKIVEPSTTEETVESSYEPKTDDELKPVVQKKNNGSGFMIIIIAGAVVLAGVIIYLISRRKKVKTVTKKSPDPVSILADKETLKGHETAYIGSNTAEPKQQARNTCLAWGRQLELEDTNDPKRRYSVSLNGTEILIGYNGECQICLNYEETVSGRHCRIFEQGAQVKVVNMSRTNPTILNGNRVEGAVELKTGDVLTIGRLHMKVRITG